MENKDGPSTPRDDEKKPDAHAARLHDGADMTAVLVSSATHRRIIQHAAALQDTAASVRYLCHGFESKDVSQSNAQGRPPFVAWCVTLADVDCKVMSLPFGLARCGVEHGTTRFVVDDAAVQSSISSTLIFRVHASRLISMHGSKKDWDEWVAELSLSNAFQLADAQFIVGGQAMDAPLSETVLHLKGNERNGSLRNVGGELPQRTQQPKRKGKPVVGQTRHPTAKQAQSARKAVYRLSLLYKCTGAMPNTSGASVDAPYVRVLEPLQSQCYPMGLDVLLCTSTTSTGTQLVQSLVQALKHQLIQLTSLVSSTEQLRPIHFKPPDMSCPVTCLCAATDQQEHESSFIELRRSAHLALMLPFDRPVFRAACEYDLERDCESCMPETSKYLKNVHLRIPEYRGAVQATAEQFLVQGSYDYFHYMQDKVDDKGWGCAYRSLMAIVSWCRYQNYTSISVPTHEEIQQTLVRIGDKPSAFLGSKEWIGANEVCYVLNELTGISSRIMHVSAGAEMESKGRELMQHFQQQGTPVMIGGGVLAYTLLGVSFDHTTGKTQFLILDPHYIGQEDEKVILEKGWCGWKTADLFVPNSFYNLCMPIRPRECF
ncbi:putative Ufm1-specific protease [Porphyridium purpureum]|uniref:Putative Ufm1-specific protease n=1 Tax=Porphyridium purpureum TaxID=35688 RepID=A0A5J4Z462_PORPP|nr:putative Ufm1-specific protease [Porphyridium purpureum]|eukprot:POR5495..scf295_1